MMLFMQSRSSVGSVQRRHRFRQRPLRLPDEDAERVADYLYRHDDLKISQMNE